MTIKENLAYIFENLSLIESIEFNGELKNDKIDFIKQVLQSSKKNIVLTPNEILPFKYNKSNCRLITFANYWLLKLDTDMYKIRFKRNVYVYSESEYWKQVNHMIALCC